MEVQVHYAAQLKAAAGEAVQKISVPPGATVRDLLELLAEKHGPSMRALLFDDEGALRRSILVFLGEEQLGRDLDRELKEGAEVTILSPVAGG